jgi:hypothetical protein
MGRSLLMAASSTQAPSAAAIDAAAAQVVAAAAGEIAGQPLLNHGQRDGQAHDPQRQPEDFPHALHLAGLRTK